MIFLKIPGFEIEFCDVSEQIYDKFVHSKINLRQIRCNFEMKSCRKKAAYEKCCFDES